LELCRDEHARRQQLFSPGAAGSAACCTPAGEQRRFRERHLEIPDLAQVARAANSASVPVRTFVIGVFSGDDLDTDGRRRLDEIASAGGSEHAIVVNAAGNVTEEFLAALSRIRSTAVSCDFQLDSVAGLDFDRVNLRVTDKAGTSRELLNVGDGSACGMQAGWHYVTDATGLPIQLRVCPAACEELESGRVKAELQIGCVTRIR
jgi:hypothetical protein